MNKEWYKYVRPGHTVKCLSVHPGRSKGAGYKPNKIILVEKIRDHESSRIFFPSDGIGVYSHEVEPEYQIGDWVKLTDKRPQKWNGEGQMDKFLGKVACITHVYENMVEFNLPDSGAWVFRRSDIDRYATEEEIEQVAPVEKEFILPKKWKVRVTPESIDALSAWRDYGELTSTLTGYCLSWYNGAVGYYISTEESLCGDQFEDFEEITFKQFKKYVLMENLVEDTKSPEMIPGEYYYVQDKHKEFWMIGRCESIEQTKNSKRGDGIATLISKYKEFCKSHGWCYYDIQDLSNKRLFRKATEDEIAWLNYCISMDRYIPYKEFSRQPKDYTTTSAPSDIEGFHIQGITLSDKSQRISIITDFVQKEVQKPDIVKVKIRSINKVKI